MIDDSVSNEVIDDLAADVTLFVDDRMENLRAARDLGLQTLHFIGDSSVSDLRRALALD